MQGSYEVITTKDFDRVLKKFWKKDKKLAQRIVSVLKILSEKPFYKGLRTHKVQSRNYGIKYSSRVTGDVRIIWDFAKGKQIIMALSVGGHSGGKSVYK